MASLTQMIENTQRVANEAAQSAIYNYTVWLREQLFTIYQRVIQEWYASYDPVFYRRHESLYHLLEVEHLIDNSLNILLSSQNITPTRRGDQDYIYNITIRQGWHGGALHDGQMKYRQWSVWGRPAVRSFIPLEECQKRIDSELNIDHLQDELSAFLEQSYHAYGLK